MKLTLLDALHARPANLFVRVAAGFRATIAVKKGERGADAKNILEVLTLGAAKGDVVEIAADGEDAETALDALRTLVARNFDADLVPETGAAAAPGVAVGAALVFASEVASDSPVARSNEEAADSRSRLERAFALVRQDLEAMVRALPAAEAALFEPEIAIVAALEGKVTAQVLAGARFEEALRDATPTPRDRAEAGAVTSDLLLDARQRLLDAHAGEPRSNVARRLVEGPPDDVVLVAHELTPSLVAALPRRVVGIVAVGSDADRGAVGAGYTSHAAILARGRGIPLLFVAPHIAEAIAQGDMLVLDTRTSPPCLWTSPTETRIAEAQAALAEDARRRREAESEAALPLAHLSCHAGAPFAVRVNVGTVHDHVPAPSDGVGLVRTELLHAGGSRAPSVDEQVAMLELLAGKVQSGPLVVRLFDGGGDKPIAWLRAPSDDPSARGIALLARHPDVLRDQATAIARVAGHADARLLIPLVRDAKDVELVRAHVPSSLRVGAMIETPAAVAAASGIAAAAEFVCIGTNDLTALVRGEDRALATRAGLDPRVLAMIGDVVAAAHAAGRTVTVCGEMAAEPSGAVILVGLGVDAISVAPSRWADVRRALAATDPASCEQAAQRALAAEVPASREQLPRAVGKERTTS